MKLVKAIMTQSPFYSRNVNQYSAEYTCYQKNGPKGFMLHSVGCAQPSATSFIKRWNQPNYTAACVHGFIDAETGAVYQTMPWDFRAPHCGGSANNTHIGVEMCEPRWLQYKGVSDRFTVSAEYVEMARTQACKTYAAAVELAAMLAKQYGWDVTSPGVILSHAEGFKRGVASGHSDPEHLWTQLGLPYTMDTFRRDVADALGIKNGEKNDSEKEDFADMDTLKKGSRGLQVKAVQALLNLWGGEEVKGYKPLTIDGDFGTKTRTATKSFQLRHGMDADGVVGPETRAALNGKR